MRLSRWSNEIGESLYPSFLGEVGQRVSSKNNNMEGRSGIIAYSPNIKFKPGSYPITVAVEAGSPDQAHEGNNKTCAIALISGGCNFFKSMRSHQQASSDQKAAAILEVP